MKGLAIGVGCKSGVDAEVLVALVQSAREAAGEGQPHALYTIAGKETELGLLAAARALELPLVFLSREKLSVMSQAAQTYSQRVVDLFGVPSVAETAALAGAGEGARLIVPRMARAGATCAIATRDPAS